VGTFLSFPKSKNFTNELNTAWKEFKTHAENLTSSNISTEDCAESIDYVVKNSNPLKGKTHKLTSSLAQDSKDAAGIMWYFQVIGNIAIMSIII